MTMTLNIFLETEKLIGGCELSSRLLCMCPINLLIACFKYHVSIVQFRNCMTLPRNGSSSCYTTILRLEPLALSTLDVVYLKEKYS